MNPRDPPGLLAFSIASAHYLAGRYTEAVKWAQQGLQRGPDHLPGYRVLCASLAQAGRIEEAKAAMSRLRQLQPEISAAWYKQSVPYTAKPMAHFLDGLRKAGLPEG
jgi:adenylate cyclase